MVYINNNTVRIPASTLRGSGVEYVIAQVTIKEMVDALMADPTAMRYMLSRFGTVLAKLSEDAA